MPKLGPPEMLVSPSPSRLVSYVGTDWKYGRMVCALWFKDCRECTCISNAYGAPIAVHANLAGVTCTVYKCAQYLFIYVQLAIV